MSTPTSTRTFILPHIQDESPEEQDRILMSAERDIQDVEGSADNLTDASRSYLAHLPEFEHMELPHLEPRTSHHIEPPSDESQGEQPTLDEFPDGSILYSDNAGSQLWPDFAEWCASNERDIRFPWLNSSQGDDLDTWVEEWNSHTETESQSGTGNYDFSYSNIRRGRAALVDCWGGGNIEGTCYRSHLLLLDEGETLTDADRYFEGPEDSPELIGRSADLITIENGVAKLIE